MLSQTTKQLISALKGGRAQHGIHLNEKLNVKWAPDVYDPPVTSAFHTVKRHHRQHHPHQHSHHRAKPKKDYPNRHSKGKVAKGVVSERKHAYRKSGGSLPSDPRTSRFLPVLVLFSVVFEKSLHKIVSYSHVFSFRLHAFRFNSCGQSKIESLDLAVGSYETIKYGSSCYMESLSPLPIPVAKASWGKFLEVWKGLLLAAEIDTIVNRTLTVESIAKLRPDEFPLNVDGWAICLFTRLFVTVEAKDLVHLLIILVFWKLEEKSFWNFYSDFACVT